MKIGLYVGSFNPLHVGHKHVIRESAKLFDKVFVIRAKSTKVPNTYLLTNHIDVDSTTYSVIDMINLSIKEIVEHFSKEYPEATLYLIRGLRNTSDMLYELNYIAWVRAIGVTISVIHILSPLELSYVSSSAIRELILIGELDTANQYL